MTESTDKTTLVIGASEEPSRYSYLAVQYLLSKNIPVKAIGKKKGNVLGVNIENELDPDEMEAVHTVTLYINPHIQKNYYDVILKLKPKRVIFNPGSENPELKELLSKNDIKTEEACTLVLISTGQF